MKPAVARVAEVLRLHGIEPEIVEFAESTRTAEEAATAVGTAVGQIVKSLVFVSAGSPLLALVSGANRASLERLAEAIGSPVTRADAATVRAATGYAIGGVPPVGFSSEFPVLLDLDLLQYGVVYAAAGTPNSVFPITPGDLLRVTGARAVALKDDSA